MKRLKRNFFSKLPRMSAVGEEEVRHGADHQEDMTQAGCSILSLSFLGGLFGSVSGGVLLPTLAYHWMAQGVTGHQASGAATMVGLLGIPLIIAGISIGGAAGVFCSVISSSLLAAVNR